MGVDEYYAEPSADEIFSGPTHELVPSSYTSFHHHHWPHHGTGTADEEDYGDNGGADERRNSFWSSRRSSIRSGIADDDGDEEELANFHFFSRDEINHAEGASTVVGDNDSAASFHTESTHDESLLADFDESETEDSDHERRMLLDNTDSDISGPSVEHVADHKFEYRSRRVQQRYYIAEEDMRIVCAGYSIVRIRLWFYYFLCIGSVGLLYLLFRWCPRQRLHLVARETPLGRCEFVVIENQWGELEIVDVDTQRYNHALSTIFNLTPNDSVDYQNDEGVVTPSASATAAHTSTHGAARSRRSSWSSYIDSDPNVPYLRIITYRYIRFLYNPVRDMFLTNSDWVGTSWETEDTAAKGLDGEVQARREQVFGKNTLEIKQPGVVKLLMDEVLHPFYIFQVFSIILWLCDEYVYYALAILIISTFSVAEALAETKKSMSRLEAVAHANSDSEITVLRSGYWLTIPSSELVPGDVYELSDPTLTMLPVDSVLLSGDCIVNESILTGESVPVTKLPASEKTLKELVDRGARSPGVSRSFLYGGTKIVRVRKPPAENDDFLPALGLTVHTGFSTTKGALVRSMMFPRPNGFRFYRDSFRYIGVMALVAMIGFSYSAVRFVMLGLDASLIILRALDIITVVVPPALPATLTIGTNFSLSRLRAKGIFCITPSRVNVSGRVNVVAFDKTGTLTEEGLDVLGVHLVGKNSQSQRKFGPLRHSARELSRESDTSLLDTLVTCHELRCVDDEIVGDPLDVRMFEFTGWTLDEERKRVVSPTGKVLHVYKQFEFGSQLRRMSVIASSGSNSSRMRVLAKGAPEIMRQICRAETLPLNFNEVLHQYTHRGYRVIACAWREVGDITDYNRDELESDLIFAGLIIFENKLKTESRSTIEKLKTAGVRTLMCTGDNVLTAVSVGRECAIIPPKTTVFAGHFDGSNELRWEGVDDASLKLNPYTLRPESGLSDNTNYTLAITGDVFSHIVEEGNYEALDQMLLRGSIFARMSPDEKHELVSKLQQIDYTACFCGDGANDCGALKEADVGVSLSEAEASVAAPFTSRRFDISCVLDVLAEGRCALSTSFSCFKYMSLYSAIQFVTVTILYDYGTNIGDFQFLWIDLFLIVPIAGFMAWSGPAPGLSKKRPGAELVSRKVLVPLLFSMFILGVFQIITWKYGRHQSWFIPPVPGDNDNLKNTDNTALFYVTSYQYIAAGWLVCDGPPFRLPVWQNIPFLATIILTTFITTVFMFIDPATPIGRLMDITPTSLSFKFMIILIVTVNLAVLLLARTYAYGPVCNLVKRVSGKLGYHKTRPRYKEIMEEDKLGA